MLPTIFPKLKKTVLPLTFIILLLLTGCSTKAIPEAGIFELDNGTLMVRGEVVRKKDNSIMIQYSRTETIRLITNEDMVLKGFPSIWAIETGQPVKINYRTGGVKNIIISITKIPRLGC